MTVPVPGWFRVAIRRTSVRIAIVIVLVVAVVGAGTSWWRKDHPAGLQGALAAMPTGVERLNFTSWSDVRLNLRVLRGSEVSTMDSWMQQAFTQDMSTVSLINTAAVATSMQTTLGFSPANIQWEASGQAKTGQVEVLRMDGDVDLTDISTALKKAGYTEPATPTGAWVAGPDLLATIDPSLSAEFNNIVLVPAQHLVVTSSSPSYLATAVATIEGKQKSLESVDSLTAMVGRIGRPTAARIWVGDFACGDLTMSQADQNAQTSAQQAIQAAGQTSPLTGFALALQSDGSMIATEQFTSASVAKGDLKARASLATGPEFGRNAGNFADDLTMVSAKTKDATVVLTFKPTHEGVFPLSSLYSGPLVFATC